MELICLDELIDVLYELLILVSACVHRFLQCRRKVQDLLLLLVHGFLISDLCGGIAVLFCIANDSHPFAQHSLFTRIVFYTSNYLDWWLLASGSILL